jgi:hypothetical protein
MKCLWKLFALLCGAQALSAQIVLDNFNATGATGSVLTSPATTWVNNVTRNPGTITVGGNARDDNGWGVSGLNLNATGYQYVTVAAQRDAGNLAPTLVVQLIDASLNTQIISVSTSVFAVGAITLVQIPIGTLTSGFNLGQITDWNIGGGTSGLVAFRMTFDSLALNLSPLPARHSADLDGNFRLTLNEVTRVIELYRTRNATEQTGAYAVNASTEDGFAPDATRANVAATLTKYHSADSDKDGRISLAELTRVIELYNYREGTLRTGKYRAQASTVDGYAPGP